MTSFKLTDIDGVVPEKYPNDSISQYGESEYSRGQISGANQIIDQLSQVELEVDVKELACIIYGKTNYKTGDLMACAEIAKAISTQLPRLIKVVSCMCNNIPCSCTPSQTSQEII